MVDGVLLQSEVLQTVQNDYLPLCIIAFQETSQCDLAKPPCVGGGQLCQT